MPRCIYVKSNLNIPNIKYSVIKGKIFNTYIVGMFCPNKIILKIFDEFGLINQRIPIEPKTIIIVEQDSVAFMKFIYFHEWLHFFIYKIFGEDELFPKTRRVLHDMVDKWL